jgi:hypothetical protein
MAWIGLYDEQQQLLQPVHYRVIRKTICNIVIPSNKQIYLKVKALLLEHFLKTNI